MPSPTELKVKRGSCTKLPQQELEASCLLRFPGLLAHSSFSGVGEPSEEGTEAAGTDSPKESVPALGLVGEADEGVHGSSPTPRVARGR